MSAVGDKDIRSTVYRVLTKPCNCNLLHPAGCLHPCISQGGLQLGSKETPTRKGVQHDRRYASNLHFFWACRTISKTTYVFKQLCCGCAAVSQATVFCLESVANKQDCFRLYTACERCAPALLGVIVESQTLNYLFVHLVLEQTYISCM